MVRVAGRAETAEWMPADFGSAFLDWVAATYPVCTGATISTHDIAESFFSQVSAATRTKPPAAWDAPARARGEDGAQGVQVR